MRTLALLLVAALSAGHCGVLSELDGELKALASRAMGSVVTVEAVTSREPAVSPLPRWAEVFPGVAPRVGRVSEGSRMATGFVFQEGYVLTLARAVEGASGILLRWDGGSAEGELVGVDGATKLAVVRVGAGSPPPPPLPLGSPELLQPGSLVVLCGNLPGGLDRSVIIGTVAGLGRHGVPGVPIQNFIQIQAPITPGMGGGPVLDSGGRCVGVTYAVVVGENLGAALEAGEREEGYRRLYEDLIRRRAAAGEGPPEEPRMGRGEMLYYALARGAGAGFAVPADLAARAAGGIVEHGGPEWGYLGILINDTPEGVRIGSVEPGSPAQRAGLAVGDLVESYDGAAVRRAPDLVTAVATSAVGSRHEVVVMRDGKEVVLSVSVEARPGAWKSCADADCGVLFGAELRTNSPDLAEALGLSTGEGVVVTRVEPESDADLAGLRGGDVILLVNGGAVTSAGELIRAAGKSRTLELSVNRAGESLALRMKR